MTSIDIVQAMNLTLISRAMAKSASIDAIVSEGKGFSHAGISGQKQDASSAFDVVEPTTGEKEGGIGVAEVESIVSGWMVLEAVYLDRESEAFSLKSG